jgi:hypothetical protein
MLRAKARKIRWICFWQNRENTHSELLWVWTLWMYEYSLLYKNRQAVSTFFSVVSNQSKRERDSLLVKIDIKMLCTLLMKKYSHVNRYSWTLNTSLSQGLLSLSRALWVKVWRSWHRNQLQCSEMDVPIGHTAQVEIYLADFQSLDNIHCIFKE